MALVDRIGAALDRTPGGIILTSVDAVVDWARGRSLWSMPMGTACCAMELIAASFAKFDFDRLGTFPRPDPRHTDVMVVAGTITRKMAPAVKRLYEQMPDPKWVIAMGNCAVSGGIFFYDSYSVVRGVDEFLPVDVYITGCPPRPESLQDAVLQLRELIATESIAPGVRRQRELLLPTSGDLSFGQRPGVVDEGESG
ncbi:MAG: NADH-quinone oxidoreductase subunit B [Coriobacteriia bacterium]|nr:NADH-quinone oxidoreductase subunit B [Coriobacteriia bacterium]